MRDLEIEKLMKTDFVECETYQYLVLDNITSKNKSYSDAFMKFNERKCSAGGDKIYFVTSERQSVFSWISMVCTLFVL